MDDTYDIYDVITRLESHDALASPKYVFMWQCCSTLVVPQHFLTITEPLRIVLPFQFPGCKFVSLMLLLFLFLLTFLPT